MRQVNHFIAGGASGEAGRRHQVWNPSTGEVQAEVALGDAAIGSGMRALRLCQDNRLASVGRSANIAIERDLSEKSNAKFGRGLARAAVGKYFAAFVAMRAKKIAHVFDYAEHRDVDFLEHGDAAAHIQQGDVLRRRDHYSACQGNVLSHG